jgi:hypothetical protein
LSAALIALASGISARLGDYVSAGRHCVGWREPYGTYDVNGTATIALVCRTAAVWREEDMVLLEKYIRASGAAPASRIA